MSKNQSPQRSREDVCRILEEYQQSGLSREEFCKKHNLNPGTFQWWLRREKSRPVQKPASTGHFIHVGSPRRKSAHIAIISGSFEMSDIAALLKELAV